MRIGRSWIGADRFLAVAAAARKSLISLSYLQSYMFFTDEPLASARAVVAHAINHGTSIVA